MTNSPKNKKEKLTLDLMSCAKKNWKNLIDMLKSKWIQSLRRIAKKRKKVKIILKTKDQHFQMGHSLMQEFMLLKKEIFLPQSQKNQ